MKTYRENSDNAVCGNGMVTNRRAAGAANFSASGLKRQDNDLIDPAIVGSCSWDSYWEKCSEEMKTRRDKLGPAPCPALMPGDACAATITLSHAKAASSSQASFGSQA
jgi:hypothetical protein